MADPMAALSPKHSRLLAYLAQQYERTPAWVAGMLRWEATQGGQGDRPIADLIEGEARRLQAYWGEVAETGKTNLGHVDGPERDQFRRWHQEITVLLDSGPNDNH